MLCYLRRSAAEPTCVAKSSHTKRKSSSSIVRTDKTRGVCRRRTSLDYVSPRNDPATSATHLLVDSLGFRKWISFKTYTFYGDSIFHINL